MYHSADSLPIFQDDFSGFPGGRLALGVRAGQTRLRPEGRSSAQSISRLSVLQARRHRAGRFCTHTSKFGAPRAPPFQRSGVMQLTKKFIKAKNPCTSGYRWFLREQNGHGDYQQILDALVAENRIDDACWLLDQFGPTDAVLTVDAIDANAIVFAGTLVVRMDINVDTVVRAGQSIRCGSGIKAGTDIVAGGDIHAGASITSGGHVRADGDIHADWGIEAQARLECGGNLRAKWDVSVAQGISVDGNIRVDQSILAGGSIKCDEGIKAGGQVKADHDILVVNGIQAGDSVLAGNHIETGWGILSGSDIVAEGSIKAGEGLAAAGKIEPGDGHGVYAGLRVRLDAWAVAARVVAQSRPKQLVSGFWCEADMSTGFADA